MAAGSARSYATLMNVSDRRNGPGKTPARSGFSSSHSCDFDAGERDHSSVGEHSGSVPLTGLITHSCGELQRFGSLFKDSRHVVIRTSSWIRCLFET